MTVFFLCHPVPIIKIDEINIEDVKSFIYLDSSVKSNASLERWDQLPHCKASGTFAQLSERVWDNPKLTNHRLFIVLVFAVSCCTAAKHGPYQKSRRWESTPSTSNVSFIFSKQSGNSSLPKKNCWDAPASPPLQALLAWPRSKDERPAHSKNSTTGRPRPRY